MDFDPVRAKLDGRVVSSPLPVGEGQGEGFCLDPATAALFPKHLEDSPLGHTPKGWEVRSLDANRIQSRTIVTLCDTLLPKLLSGELSVAEVEKEVLA
jgi:hypothetical protein